LAADLPIPFLWVGEARQVSRPIQSWHNTGETRFIKTHIVVASKNDFWLALNTSSFSIDDVNNNDDDYHQNNRNNHPLHSSTGSIDRLGGWIILQERVARGTQRHTIQVSYHIEQEGSR
jgi:hypothetical protein